MSLWALVPVKPFALSKSRLAPVLSAEERVGLSRAFLEHTLSVLREVSAVSETLVISRDPAALAVARAHGAQTVLETEPSDLNAALMHATDIARQGGARALLILPMDLPCLADDEIRQLIDDAADLSLTIAPDRRETGTNALFIRPPGLINYAFGADSFHQHCALAQRAGVSPRIVRLPGLALDVDVPDDLKLVEQLNSPISIL